MKRIILLLSIVLATASCSTSRSTGPFYDIREINGTRYFIGTPELEEEVENAMRSYSMLYGFTAQEIDDSAVTVAGELFVTEEAMSHYLNFNSKPKD